MKQGPSLFTKLFTALNIAVFEYQDAKEGFSLLGTPPGWIFKLLPKEVLTKSCIPLQASLNFLQAFLPDAQLHWNKKSLEALYSGVWQEGNDRGKQYQAIAVSLESRHLLLIHELGEVHIEWQQVLQQARNNTLLHEKELKVHQTIQSKLGKQLDESEHLNQNLIAILDQLEIGTIIINSQGYITYVNNPGERLVGGAWKNRDDGQWKFNLPLDAKEISQLSDSGNCHPSKREKVSVQFPGKRGNYYSVDIDIKDDSRIPGQQIWYLYDNTEIQSLRMILDQKNRFHHMVGKSKAMQTIFQRIQEIGNVEASVLIHGETGTGKELVARALHASSPRHRSPFIPVNCAGLTDSLLGSQLFGHKRGAFTGAFEDHRGFFESADGGTIFLDEIGDMPPSVQATLLRVLQEKEIMRLGESKARKVDVRIVAATNKDLPALVATGKFRSDLFYRIRVARIDLPALRDRREDIPLLVSEFLTESVTENRKSVEDLHAEAMQVLLRYSWPGNIRELKSAIDFAVIHCPAKHIRATDLPPELFDSGSPTPLPSTHERDVILKTLEHVKGNRAAAARNLGISRATFYRRLQELGIELNR